MCAAPSSVSSAVLEQLLMAAQLPNTRRDLLVIDLRTIIPTTLVKRPSFTFDKAISNIPGPTDMAKFRDWRLYKHIVIYDSTSDNSSGTVVAAVLDKLKSDCPTICPMYLDCGFDKFATKHPNLIVGSAKSIMMPLTPPSPSTSQLSPSRPHCKIDSIEVLGKPNFKAKRPTALRLNLTCPTKNLGNLANPLIKQKFDCQLRLLSTMGPETLPSSLPIWFYDLFKTGGVISELQAKFQTIQLSKYSNNSTNEGAINAEAQIQLAKQKDVSVGVAASNKNRYCNIWPFEYNRVKLHNRSSLVHPSDSSSDYINASFIQPPMSSAQYIATQAPLPHTIPDFWQMIWDQNSRIIINLTPESELASSRTHLYWPLTDAPLLINNHYHVVRLLNEHKLTDSIIHKRLTFTNQESSASRQVSLVTFSDWEDADTPPDIVSVLRLLLYVNTLNSEYDEVVAQEARNRGDFTIGVTSGPMVIHCSAGCGRTGTFITIRTALHHLALDARINNVWRTPSTSTMASAIAATIRNSNNSDNNNTNNNNNNNSSYTTVSDTQCESFKQNGSLCGIPPTPITFRSSLGFPAPIMSPPSISNEHRNSRDMYTIMSKPSQHTLSHSNFRMFLRDNHCMKFSPAETIDTFYTCLSRSPSPLKSPAISFSSKILGPRSPSLLSPSVSTFPPPITLTRHEQTQFSLLSPPGTGPTSAIDNNNSEVSTPIRKMNGFFDQFPIGNSFKAQYGSNSNVDVIMTSNANKRVDMTSVTNTTSTITPTVATAAEATVQDVQMTDVLGTDKTDFIFSLVKALREQRVSMVQTAKQYLFCYEVLLHVLLHYGKSAPAETPTTSTSISLV